MGRVAAFIQHLVRCHISQSRPIHHRLLTHIILDMWFLCACTQAPQDSTTNQQRYAICCVGSRRTLPAMETFLPFLVRALVFVFCPCIGRP